MCLCVMCVHSPLLWKLTWVLLALFEGLVDVDEGEVVSLRVLEFHVSLSRLWLHVCRGSYEASWCCNKTKCNV